MNSAQAPPKRDLYRHWIREARISEEDGHPDAARAAYAYAAEAAGSAPERALAEYLGESLPRKGP